MDGLAAVDAATSAAAVSVGYAVEPFVGDDAWMRALEAMATSWRSGGHAQALSDFLDAAGNELATAAVRAGRLQSGTKGGEA